MKLCGRVINEDGNICEKCHREKMAELYKKAINSLWVLIIMFFVFTVIVLVGYTVRYPEECRLKNHDGRNFIMPCREERNKND